MTPPAVLQAQQGTSTKVAVVGALFGGAGRKADTTITRYEGVAAPVSVGATPKFCFGAPTSAATANFVIGRLDVTKDYRQIESVSKMEAYGKGVWIPQKRLVAVEVKRVSNAVVEIAPKDPLSAGQYLLVGPGVIGSYDFGVHGDK